MDKPLQDGPTEHEETSSSSDIEIKVDKEMRRRLQVSNIS
jgi:hypothetical protein